MDITAPFVWGALLSRQISFLLSLGLQGFPLSKKGEGKKKKTKPTHLLKAAEISSATSAGKE